MAGRAIDWNEETSTKPSEFPVWPKGRYQGQVADVQFGEYPGGAKMDACHMVIVEMKLTNGSETQTLKDRFYMWDTQLWKHAQFFNALGVPKNPDGSYSVPKVWSQMKGKLIGRKCYVNLNVDTYNGNDNNKISGYTDKAPVNSTVQPTETKSDSLNGATWGNTGNWN